MTAVPDAPSSAAPPRRRLPRRVPVPASLPAYDDERSVRLVRPAAAQGVLALDLRARAPRPPAPAGPPLSPARHLHLIAGGAATAECEPLRPAAACRPRSAAEVERFFAPQPTPRAALPDPCAWSARFVQALVEVIGGDRPVAQLVRWTSETVYADVTRRAGLLAGHAGQRSRRRPALVRSIHVCEPRDGVAEISARVHQHGRARAIALRLEGVDGRWRCTALQLG